MSESIDFNKPLKDACRDEISANCQDVSTGHTRVIRCLQEGKRAKYSDGCKKELQRLEKDMSRDYRLNTRLEKACDTDRAELCKDVCETVNESCGGKVLRCLVDKKDEIKSTNCKNEVFYFVKMEVEDFGNDIILAELCRQDVDKFCKDVKAGEGRVHACLRNNRENLSDKCRQEELKLEIEESNNFDLRTNLKKVCAEERQVFCGEVSTGKARVFRCLVHNLGKADFGDACKSEILKKLMRRQQNWKLDVTLRTACKEDAQEVCGNVDHDQDHADVTRCLIQNHADLSDNCGYEVARAAHMALFVWQPDAPLSKVCDKDVKVCRSKRPLISEYPGRVLGCLKRQVLGGRNATTGVALPKKQLEPECATLVNVAEPPDEKEEFDTYFEKIAQLKLKNKMTQVGMWDHKNGVTITGYTALACFSALCTSIVMGLHYLYKRWRGVKDSTQYVQVVKQGDI